MNTYPRCSSAKLLKHGLARNGQQRYSCPDCRRTSRPAPGTNAYDEARNAETLRAYQERTSLRDLMRVFGVWRQTVTAWVKIVRSLPPLAQTLTPPRPVDSLVLDGLCTFVGGKWRKVWFWLYLCRRT